MLSKKMVGMISFFFLISNKYALIKGKPKYTGSEQGKRNYKEKLQESRKSIKKGKIDFARQITNPLKF